MASKEFFLVFLLGSMIFLIFSLALSMFLIFYKRKRQMHLTEKNELQYQYQQQLLQSRLEVQEQSFQYFSQEIHDNVGQVLTLCKLHLHQLAASEQTKEGEELIQQSTSLLTQALTDLRTISHTLNGSFVNRAGLKEALEKEIKYVASTKKMNVGLDIKGNETSLSAERELLIFRIIQEVITNALKHAEASAINIILDYSDDDMTVRICDNGKGFDAADPELIEGIGLSNIRLRTTLLNGTVSFNSAPGKGAEVSLKIPYTI